MTFSQPVLSQTEPANSNGLLLHGTFLKFGWMTKPELEKFGDKWIAGIGFDKGISPYLAWGMEFQPYFRSFKGSGDEMSVKFNTMAGNLFVNLKGGINIGNVLQSKKLKFLNPLTIYGGIGIGTELSKLSISIDGDSSSTFNARFAWHLIFATEYQLNNFALFAEIQPVKVINPDLEPKTQAVTYFLVGIRFNRGGKQ